MKKKQQWVLTEEDRQTLLDCLVRLKKLEDMFKFLKGLGKWERRNPSKCIHRKKKKRKAKK